MNEIMEIDQKRAFWRRVLMVGVLIVVVSLLTMVALYCSGVNTAKANADLWSDFDMDIAEHAAKYGVISKAAKWTLPFAILGLLVLNIARFRLRKLKRQEHTMTKSSN